MFEGWQGACAGTADCVVGGDGTTARFLRTAWPLTVSVQGGDLGQVTISTSPNLDCASLCKTLVPAGATAVIRAAPKPGASVSWAGDCISATGSECQLSALQSHDALVAFRRPSTFSLTVHKIGSGSIVVEPGGTICNSLFCVVKLPVDTPVTLEALPVDGSIVRWSEQSCAGSRCTFSSTADRSIDVEFAHLYGLQIDFVGTGGGHVTGPGGGLLCDRDCSRQFDAGTVIALSAAPDSVSRSPGFRGDCSGQSCSLDFSSDKFLTAQFERVFSDAISGSTPLAGTSLAIEPDGGVVLVGALLGTAQLGSVSFSSAAGVDGILAGVSPNGAVRWSFQTNSPADSSAQFLYATHSRQGELFAVGKFRGKLSMAQMSWDAGSAEPIFVLLLDAAHAFRRVALINSSVPVSVLGVTSTPGGVFVSILITQPIAIDGTIVSPSGPFDLAVVDFDDNLIYRAAHLIPRAQLRHSGPASTLDGGFVVASGFAGAANFGCGPHDAGPADQTWYLGRFDSAMGCVRSTPLAKGTVNDSFWITDVYSDRSGNIIIGGAISGTVYVLGSPVSGASSPGVFNSVVMSINQEDQLQWVSVVAPNAGAGHAVNPGANWLAVAASEQQLIATFATNRSGFDFQGSIVDAACAHPIDPGADSLGLGVLLLDGGIPLWATCWNSEGAGRGPGVYPKAIRALPQGGFVLLTGNSAGGEFAGHATGTSDGGTSEVAQVTWVD